MSVQLKELIDKIKNEGVKEAEDKASAIIKQAEGDAKKIISDAKAEAKSILEKVDIEVTQIRSSSKQAIKQAARDTVLSLKTEIAEIFNKILSSELPIISMPKTSTEKREDGWNSSASYMGTGYSRDSILWYPSALLFTIDKPRFILPFGKTIIRKFYCRPKIVKCIC